MVDVQKENGLERKGGKKGKKRCRRRFRSSQSDASMTNSNINGKQKDRVAYWGGGGSSCGESSILACQKKSYRARGCRGGTSRKNRKLNQPTRHENEENIPHRLNISGKHTDKNPNHVNDEEPQRYKVAANDSSNKRYAVEMMSSGGSRSLEESKLESQSHPQRKMRILPILPSSSGLSVCEEDQLKHEIQTEKSEDELLIQSRNIKNIKTNNSHSPTNSLAHIHLNSTTPRNTTTSGSISAIARRSSDQSPDRQSGAGFSFFCISPSSFLAGRFAAK